MLLLLRAVTYRQGDQLADFLRKLPLLFGFVYVRERGGAHKGKDTFKGVQKLAKRLAMLVRNISRLTLGGTVLEGSSSGIYLDNSS